MNPDPSIVALIPARAGSTRIPNKNMRPLAGHSLVDYRLAAAYESRIFRDIWVATDDLIDDVRVVADRYGAKTIRRQYSAWDEPDIIWIKRLLDGLTAPPPDAFAILRPTSPFLGADVIRAAWEHFTAMHVDSLRLMRKAREHPGKMWLAQRDQRVVPLLPFWTRTGEHGQDAPWHSAPTQTLIALYVQTGGLEILWTKTVRTTETISGSAVVGYVVEGPVALDLNTEEDWQEAERLIASGAVLPHVA